MNAFLRDPTDLSNLQIIDASAVEKFLEDLQNYKGDKRLIAAIGTGGTISMKTENGIRLPDLDFNSILKELGQSEAQDFKIITLNAFCIDSSQMSYAHVRDLVIVMSYIWKNIDNNLQGFLVAHGTDTMAFAAAASSLMLGQGLPFSVIYTGSQKPIQEKLNDAAQNLTHALYTLEALYDNNMAEVVVVMGDKAILGTSSVKIDDTLVNAFDAPLHKYVTTYSSLEYPVRLAEWLKPKRNVKFSPTIWPSDYSQTLVIHSSLGLCPERIQRQVQDPQVKAVLLFSYGAGTIDDQITKAVMQPAQARDLPVFIVSPVNTEFKTSYKSSEVLLAQGVTPLYMTLPAALAKIEVALEFHDSNKEKISEFMATNYVGEIPTEASRFSPILER